MDELEPEIVDTASICKIDNSSALVNIQTIQEVESLSFCTGRKLGGKSSIRSIYQKARISIGDVELSCCIVQC